MEAPLVPQDVPEAYTEDNPRLTYLHLGIQAALLLNSGAVDFVITGCGTVGPAGEAVLPFKRTPLSADTASSQLMHICSYRSTMVMLYPFLTQRDLAGAQI